MSTCIVFDIETVPDLETGRRLYDLHGLNDADTASAMFALRRAQVGHDFLPHYLQKIVAISLVLSQGHQLKVWSLDGDHEAAIITRFFKGIDKHKPILISWNGSGFDLPVLHYRALLHGIAAPTYWDMGEHDTSFRWNNYLNRFHLRHIDLMDVLAGYQNKAFAPLDNIAHMLGLPGKMGMSGDKVWDAYQQGQIQDIRNYCETDVLNTYGVYLRFERMRGALTPQEYDAAMQRLHAYLQSETDKPHLLEFERHMGQI